MTLLLFEDPSKCPLGDLVASSQRQQVADRLNTAILSSLRQDEEPRLANLLRVLLWGQGELGECIHFPRMRSFTQATLEEPGGDPSAVVQNLQLSSMTM